MGNLIPSVKDVEETFKKIAKSRKRVTKPFRSRRKGFSLGEQLSASTQAKLQVFKGKLPVR